MLISAAFTTTDELRDFYGHITSATAELRQEFDLMAAKGMTPSEFGLKVKSHPAGLTITAANKSVKGWRCHFLTPLISARPSRSSVRPKSIGKPSTVRPIHCLPRER